ncbi:hypothetical protein [Methylobacterium gossipiicola]|uniref:Uncharacterized protein n=1 Tax=Methylobacterium gossipiicola TaxID=582675 RepID=A0A1I2UXG9_9HYPH|nr:hypothetical protein [Methylobacterium gossipiicola]SFG79531.1 hypothetical protein SAMN05192565_111110 [Methylobacterium gossipiicola]
MDFESIIRNSGLDRYDRNARLYPALLCILPVFAIVILWFPPAWTMIGGLLSIAVTFGGIYLLAQVVRYRGRTVENRLGRRVGRAKTASLLCHNNNELPANSKLRYHAFLRKKGQPIPTHEEEQANPEAAYEAFRAAVDWLLIYTRPNAKASGLLSENISYGFRRNLLGLKPVAIFFLGLAIVANGYMCWISGNKDQIVAALVVEILFACALAAWLFVIRPGFVEDASAAYAKRFLEQCEQKSGTPRNPSPSRQ